MYTTKLRKDRSRSGNANATKACIMLLGYLSCALKMNSQMTHSEPSRPHAESHSEMVQNLRVSSVLATASMHVRKEASSASSPAATKASTIAAPSVPWGSPASSVPSAHWQMPVLEEQGPYDPRQPPLFSHGGKSSTHERVYAIPRPWESMTSVA